MPLLRKAIAQMDSEDGWVGLGAVGQRLANVVPDFDSRTYGYRKLSDLVREIGDRSNSTASAGRGMRIRLKRTPEKPPAPEKRRPL